MGPLTHWSAMFESDFTPFLKLFVALVALSHPFWGTPVFLSLTAGFTPEERRRTALITPCAVAATALVTLLLGQGLLAFFGIHVPSFRIAGGIIILLMALTMLSTKGETSRSIHPTRARDAISPWCRLPCLTSQAPARSRLSSCSPTICTA